VFSHWVTLWFTVVGEALLAYLLILNTLYLVFAIISFFELQRHRRRWTARDLDVIVRSPLVLTRTVRYRRIAGEPVESDSTTDIGGVVRNTSGEPVAGASLVLEGSAREPVFTNVLGQYLISAVARGALRVRVTPPGGKARAVALNVPAASYDIILE